MTFNVTRVSVSDSCCRVMQRTTTRDRIPFDAAGARRTVLQPAMATAYKYAANDRPLTL